MLARARMRWGEELAGVPATSTVPLPPVVSETPTRMPEAPWSAIWKPIDYRLSYIYFGSKLTEIFAFIQILY